MKRTLDAPLKHLNSFAVEARARELLELESADDLSIFEGDFRFDPARDLVLGSGSNVLFAGDVNGTVVLNRISGRGITRDTGNRVLVEACAGENWHQLVLWSVEQGLSGIENLSLIPGLAGAAPIQNIGAYGVELSDVLDSLQALNLESGELHDFTNEDCQFAYRDSRFKSADAGKYLITRIRLLLSREFNPTLGYAGLNEELETMGVTTPTAKHVSQAVIRIRRRKLPDPGLIGNAGSFFKNPVINRAKALNLGEEFPAIPTYSVSDIQSKVSAAWLIEQCGWKGRSMGGAAVSDQHALVLINKDNATGGEILALATAVRESVLDRFGIELQPEPRIIRS